MVLESRTVAPRVLALLICMVAVSWVQSSPSGRDEYHKPGTKRLSCPTSVGVVQPRNRVNTSMTLARLRTEMRRENAVRAPQLDAFIVTSDDDHQSEYVADRDKRAEFISGFSGSYGTAVVTRRLAALWTDGRYHLQADSQLNCDWLLMREGQPEVPTFVEWLRQVLKPGSKVGADSKLIPHSKWEEWSTHLAHANISLVEVGNNPVDRIWTKRANYSSYTAYVYDVQYAGVTWQSKVEALREQLKSLEADAMVVTSLDEVAWLLNIRGRDIPYHPFLRSYVLVEAEKLHLYVDDNKLSPPVRRQLRTDNCHGSSPYCTTVHPYENVFQDLRTRSQLWMVILLPTECVYTKGASHAIYSAIPLDKQFPRESPIIRMKARKNPSEITGMRNAHVRDAAALCSFLADMEESLQYSEPWDELNVSISVDRYRHEQELNRGISFASIVGFGPHGALPHYQPDNRTSLRVDNTSTLVLDSGGHYFDGTTDVTRTLHFGKPTAFQREVYTRVLIGHIQLAALVFPANITTTMVDVLARAPLWQAGLDFLHGTGHGIGAFLGVHESPVHIAYRTPPSQWVNFEEGYFFSDEPGYYAEGEFGVRLENVLEVVKHETKYSLGSGPFFAFRPATLVPYEPRLIDPALLTSEHRRWLNEYNVQVRVVVGAELKKQKRMKGFYWMMNKTDYIPEHCITRTSAAEDSRPLTILIVVAMTSLFVVAATSSS